MRRRDRSRAATPATMGMNTGASGIVGGFGASAPVGETVPEGGTE